MAGPVVAAVALSVVLNVVAGVVAARVHAFGRAAWVFRFRYGGVDGGELVVRRADLRRGDWHVTASDEVGQRLTGAGLPPAVP